MAAAVFKTDPETEAEEVIEVISAIQQGADELDKLASPCEVFILSWNSWKCDFWRNWHRLIVDRLMCRMYSGIWV